MLINFSELISNIETTIKNIKSRKPIDFSSISRLKEALELITAANETFQINIFPTDESSCLKVINLPDNSLSEYDIDGLKNLAKVIQEVLDISPENS